MLRPPLPRDRVRRDAHGIPHLWGADVIELARLQGRETAIDRGWQMEHQRWRMEGRTAEHLGARGLPWDRFARQVRLEPTVRACFERLDDETRGWVESYVDGVNEGMPLGLARAPELRLLGLDSYAGSPTPWQPWTPLGVFWAIHLLFGTFPSKLFNAHVVERLGAAWLPLLSAEGDAGGQGAGATMSGSNAWVVGGHRTAGGKPLIAGDPHRIIDLPSCYQQVGLACPGVDVVGFTFPGVPGVQHFAHAGAVAWGITNAMADYQDLTTESLRCHPDGQVEARGVDGWEPVAVSSETVVVHGRPDVEVPVVVTARGPVVTGLDDGLEAALEPNAGAGPAAYSLRTPTQTGLDLGFGAFLPLLRARSVDDVEAALARWVEPVNSALVADVSGRMRHLVVGRVPRRHPDNLAGPVAAWDERHRWQDGWADMPATDITDVMVSANDRASGGGLGFEYATPFRANRIRELVDEHERLTADDCAAIHVDTLNGQAALMRELVAAADVAGEPGGEAAGEAAAVRAELLGWDGCSAVGSRDAAMFSAWRHAFVTWFADHPALERLHEPTGHSSLFDPWLSVTAQLGVGWQSWAPAASALGIDVAGGVRAALDHVARQPDRAGAGAPATWGDRHRLDPVHALDGQPGAPSVVAAAVPGDRGCVLAASSTPGVSDRCSIGPVARYVWDLADRDASRWVVPFGADGVGDAPHATDQLTAWLTGALVPVAPAARQRLPGRRRSPSSGGP